MNKHDIKDILRVVLVLCAVALIAGVLLSTVHYFTEVTDEEKLQRLKEGMTDVYENVDELTALDFGEFTTEVGAVLNVYSKDSDYVIHAMGKGGYGGSIELMLFIKNDVIQGICKAKSSETPGVGSKALAEAHLNKYVGKNVSTVFSSTKDEGEIEFITGATRSSTAVNNAVTTAVSWYKQRSNG